MDVSREIVSLFDASTILPLHIVRVDLQDKAKDTLESFRAASGTSRILREWIESSGALKSRSPVIRIPFARNSRISCPPNPSSRRTQPLRKPSNSLRNLKSSSLCGTMSAGTMANPSLREMSRSLIARSWMRPPPPAQTRLSLHPAGRNAQPPYRARHLSQAVSPALSSWMIGMLPAHILEGKPQDWWAVNFNRKPVGTGPFRFDEWKTNEYVRVTVIRLLQRAGTLARFHRLSRAARPTRTSTGV